MKISGKEVPESLIGAGIGMVSAVFIDMSNIGKMVVGGILGGMTGLAYQRYIESEDNANNNNNTIDNVEENQNVQAEQIY